MTSTTCEHTNMSPLPNHQGERCQACGAQFKGGLPAKVPVRAGAEACPHCGAKCVQRISARELRCAECGGQWRLGHA
jgi:hypothetical protein